MGGPPGAGVVTTRETEGRLCPKSGTTPLLGGAAPGRVSTRGREHQRRLALPRNAHAGPTLRGLTSGSPGGGPATPGTAASLRPDSSSTASPPQFPWLRAGEGGPSSSQALPWSPLGFSQPMQMAPGCPSSTQWGPGLEACVPHEALPLVAQWGPSRAALRVASGLLRPSLPPREASSEGRGSRAAPRAPPHPVLSLQAPFRIMRTGFSRGPLGPPRPPSAQTEGPCPGNSPAEHRPQP